MKNYPRIITKYSSYLGLSDVCYPEVDLLKSMCLKLFHSKRPKLYIILAFVSPIGSRKH